MRNLETNQYNLEIFAGPCSVNFDNMHEIYDIADLQTKQGNAVYGTRVVGLKSRTELDPTGNGMGIDFNVIMGTAEQGAVPPSVEFAEQLVKDTGLVVATEVMMPARQLVFYEGRIPEGKLLAWNPSVDQLGWHTLETAEFTRRNNWDIGIKNGKALGVTLDEANNPQSKVVSTLEKSWKGTASYAHNPGGRLILIQRGVDVPEKGNHRNAPVHEVARKVKRQIPHSLLYFDPSHSLGPKMRDQILGATVEAMHMRDRDEFLYDGILIETGTSDTDTEQHITISELDNLVHELSSFRTLRAPKKEETVLFQSASIGVVR